MIELLLLSIFPAGMIIAAITDIYDFKIPNWVSASLFVGFAPAAIALGAPLSVIAQGYLLGCAVLVICFILFAVKFFGAGDAKLLAAAAPWIGISAFFPFLMGMVLTGGALAIFLIIFRAAPVRPLYAHAPFLIRMHQNRHEIPYGVAIAGGGLSAFASTPLFHIAFTG